MANIYRLEAMLQGCDALPHAFLTSAVIGSGSLPSAYPWCASVAERLVGLAPSIGWDIYAIPREHRYVGIIPASTRPTQPLRYGDLSFLHRGWPEVVLSINIYILWLLVSELRDLHNNNNWDSISNNCHLYHAQHRYLCPFLQASYESVHGFMISGTIHYMIRKRRNIEDGPNKGMGSIYACHR